MNKSIRVMIELHVCHKAIVCYSLDHSFQSFDNFCEYIRKDLLIEQPLPRFIKKLLFSLTEEVDVIFGLGEGPMLEIVTNFFIDELWVKYKPIVLPLKEMYDIIKI
jgi:hypothetical protein